MSAVVCHVCGRSPRSADEVWPEAVCQRCVQQMRDDLDRIAGAWQHLCDEATPAASSAGSTGERPLPGGAARLAFIGRGMTSPAGCLAHIAACLRQTIVGVEPGHTPVVPRATLPLIAAAVRADLDSGGLADPDIDLHARMLSSLAALGTELCGWSEQGLWVRCPSPMPDGSLCGRRLRVDAANLHTSVTCWWCHTAWTVAQLLHRAVHADGDAWADVESIATQLGLDVSTVKTWARTGRVASRGLQVRIPDVVAARDAAIESGHRRLASAITTRTIGVEHRCHTCSEVLETEGATLAEVRADLAALQAQHRARHSRRWHTDGTSELA